ncbi:MAG: AraC family transcriptional regulator [Clostridia bacterium]|nr:AraC family transcriptional regulator [Clostridia bacterium]
MSACIENITYSEEISHFSAHKHNVYQVLYITEGAVELNISNKTYNINAPAVVFISHLEEHDFKVKSKTYKRYALYINPEKLKGFTRDNRLISIFSNRPENFQHYISVDETNNLIRSVFEILYSEFNSKNASADILNGQFKCLLLILSKNYPKHFSSANCTIENIVAKIKYELESDFSREHSLEALAKKHNVSIYYLSHAFKATTGYGIKQYLILCRISAAKEMLTYTELSISEICFSVGFNDLSNFSRIFTRITGHSPSAYRSITKQKEAE